MNDTDENLTRLLNRLAPPARDPLFRVQVMERKERQLFRRRLAWVLGALALMVVATVVGMTAGGGANEMARFMALGVGIGAGVMVYVLALRHVIRRF